MNLTGACCRLCRFAPPSNIAIPGEPIRETTHFTSQNSVRDRRSDKQKANKLPEHYGQAKAFFRSRGAYARFKQLLESEGVLEKWYQFEEESVEQALRDWCAENSIQLIEKGDESSA